MTRISLFPPPKASKQRITQTPDAKRLKLTIYLTRDGKDNLERLRLESLDRQGREPTESQIIEGLLKTALKKEKMPRYRIGRRSQA